MKKTINENVCKLQLPECSSLDSLTDCLLEGKGAMAIPQSGGFENLLAVGMRS